MNGFWRRKQGLDTSFALPVNLIQPHCIKSEPDLHSCIVVAMNFNFSWCCWNSGKKNKETWNETCNLQDLHFKHAIPKVLVHSWEGATLITRSRRYYIFIRHIYIYIHVYVTTFSMFSTTLLFDDLLGHHDGNYDEDDGEDEDEQLLSKPMLTRLKRLT